MRRISRRFAAAVMVAWLVMLANSGRAQESEETTAGGTTVQNAPKHANGYRVEFVIRELEEGKRVNVRSYLMMVVENRVAKVRVGSRVPYAAGEHQFQYQDVGMNIDCRLFQEPDNSLALVTSIDWSSLAANEGAGSLPNNPVLRQLKFTADSLIPPAKPTVIGSMDDVASNHRYEIEVTATKVK
jgi:hypothetical protein